MFQGVFQINGWTSQFEVDKTVPDLFGLLKSESSHFVPTICILCRILKHVLVPENRVFNELLISQGSDCSAVLVSTEFEDISFNFHVNVVVK